MISWSEALRYELARSNVHVCVVCPGRVDTEFFDHETFRSRQLGPETKHVIPVETVSRATLRAIDRRQQTVFVPSYLRLVVWLSQAAPFLYRKISGRALTRRVDAIYLRSGAAAP
jgi:short-subunit dehydrogenase